MEIAGLLRARGSLLQYCSGGGGVLPPTTTTTTTFSFLLSGKVGCGLLLRPIPSLEGRRGRVPCVGRVLRQARLFAARPFALSRPSASPHASPPPPPPPPRSAAAGPPPPRLWAPPESRALQCWGSAWRRRQRQQQRVPPPSLSAKDPHIPPTRYMLAAMSAWFCALLLLPPGKKGRSAGVVWLLPFPTPTPTPGTPGRQAAALPAAGEEVGEEGGAADQEATPTHPAGWLTDRPTQARRRLAGLGTERWRGSGARAHRRLCAQPRPGEEGLNASPHSGSVPKRGRAGGVRVVLRRCMQGRGEGAALQKNHQLRCVTVPLRTQPWRGGGWLFTCWQGCKRRCQATT